MAVAFSIYSPSEWWRRHLDFDKRFNGLSLLLFQRLQPYDYYSIVHHFTINIMINSLLKCCKGSSHIDFFSSTPVAAYKTLAGQPNEIWLLARETIRSVTEILVRQKNWSGWPKFPKYRSRGTIFSRKFWSPMKIMVRPAPQANSACYCFARLIGWKVDGYMVECIVLACLL